MAVVKMEVDQVAPVEDIHAHIEYPLDSDASPPFDQHQEGRYLEHWDRIRETLQDLLARKKVDRAIWHQRFW